MTTTATVSRRRPSLRSVEERNRLVEENINLVYGYLHRKWPRYATDDDVIQAGRLGLIRAAELWDETRTAFSTYAEIWMRNYVQNEVRDRGVICIPRERGTRYAGDAARARRVVVLEGYDLPDREPSDAAVLDARQAEMRAKLRWAMERMSRADAKFLRLRCFGRMTTREIAERVGLSNTRMKQIQQAVLERLNRVLREKSLF